MTRLLMVGLIVAAFTVGPATTPSWAQFPNSPLRPGNPYVPSPAISPYLNLARGGNPAINYYGLVRPQIAFNNELNTLQREINTVSGQAGAGVQGQGDSLSTGHPIQFMNLTHFFPGSPNRGSSGVAPSPMSRPTTSPSTPASRYGSRYSRGATGSATGPR
jgi:hypothetical protein